MRCVLPRMTVCQEASQHTAVAIMSHCVALQAKAGIIKPTLLLWPCVNVSCCRAAVKAWGARLAKAGTINPDQVDWVVEPKVDGLAVRIVYRLVWGLVQDASAFAASAGVSCRSPP